MPDPFTDYGTNWVKPAPTTTQAGSDDKATRDGWAPVTATTVPVVEDSGRPTPTATVPQKTQAELDSDFYKALQSAQEAAAGGDPTELRNFDSFFGFTRPEEEYTPLFYKTRAELTEKWVNNYMAGADTTGDGSLNQSEAGAHAWTQYDDEQTKDGKLTKAEVTAMVNRRMDAGFTEFNANGDPQLTGLANIINDMVAKNDANGDHKLTKEELGNNIWLQYSDKARSDGYVTQTEAAELVQDRVKSGYHISDTNLAKGETGIAINKLMGDTVNNDVYAVAEVEEKLGVKLPNWIASDKKVSETELAKFIDTQVRQGNLAFSSTAGVKVTNDSNLQPLVAVGEPPIPPTPSVSIPEAPAEAEPTVAVGEPPVPEEEGGGPGSQIEKPLLPVDPEEGQDSEAEEEGPTEQFGGPGSEAQSEDGESSNSEQDSDARSEVEGEDGGGSENTNLDDGPNTNSESASRPEHEELAELPGQSGNLTTQSDNTAAIQAKQTAIKTRLERIAEMRKPWVDGATSIEGNVGDSVPPPIVGGSGPNNGLPGQQ